MKKFLMMALAAAVSACGGDGEGQAIGAIDAVESAAAKPQRLRALAVPNGADERLNADRLMDFAEAQYKDLFPTPETTRSLDNWFYRYYAQSGVFLAVINWRIYVVGGPLGAEVRDVGEVSDYITIAPPSNVAPTVSLTLALTQTSTSPTLTLTATAADSDGTVTKVEYFNGAAKLGETLASPHVLTLNNVAAGLYELTAKATDSGGLTATTPASRLQVSTNAPDPGAGAITVASLAKCATSLGSSSATSYSCMVGSTPTGSQTGLPERSCSMAVSAAGTVTVTTDGQTYSVEVPSLKTTERRFTKTGTSLNFDYGPITPTGSALRIRGRTSDKVPGQFFQQGGSLVIEVKRAAPAADISCTIALAMS